MSHSNAELVMRALQRWMAGRGFPDGLLAPGARWIVRGRALPASPTPAGRPSRRIRHLVSRDDIVIAVWQPVPGSGEDSACDHAWVFRMQGGRAIEVEVLQRSAAS
jgi:hypothetical protein